MPSQTATGTIALEVGDENDNCPTLTSHLEFVCSYTEKVNITAQDGDDDPNAAPFLFSLAPEVSQEDWKVEPLSGMNKSPVLLYPVISLCCNNCQLYCEFVDIIMDTVWQGVTDERNWPDFVKQKPVSFSQDYTTAPRSQERNWNWDSKMEP